jgi:peptidoglycan/LPS O-acetylase OafA/YrhL
MSKTKQASPNSISYFKGIDILRFICATGVIFHHCTLILRDKGFVTKAEALHRYSGSFFLDVFFIISGFLISLILIKEHQLGTFTLKNFYARRIIRIWPLYFLVVLVKVIIIPLSQHYPWEFLKESVLYACTFTVNYQLLFSTITPEYTILWSVCIEEHIYLLLPLLLFVFNGKFKTIGWVLLVTGFLSWLYFKSVPAASGLNTPYFVSTSYFYYFGIGTLIAYFYNAGVKLKFLFIPLTQLVILFVMVLIVFNIIPYNYSLPQVLVIHGFFGGYLVWAATQEDFVLKLNVPVSKYLGNISFSMYMIHIMVASYIIKAFKHSDVKFSEALCGWGIPVAVLLITMAISTLLYYCFEGPILKLKKRFTTVASK